MFEEHRHLPDANRLSVLVAAILLAFALAQVVETQHYSLAFDILGIRISLPLNMTIAATLLATGLTAAGMDWLLRDHPHFEKKNTFQHWLLPALTTFVIGIPLYSLQSGSAWWFSFALGGVLLLLVFLSEYIVLDPSDVRYPAASAGLTALSFALFLTMASGEIDAAVKENLAYLSAIRKAVRAALKRKAPLEYLEEIGIEECGKSRVYLGGLAETLHRRNLRALYKHVLENSDSLEGDE